MKPRKRVTETEIEHILHIPSGSEDELEVSDEDSDDDMIRLSDLVINEVEKTPQLLEDDYLDQTLSESSSQASNSLNITVPSVSGHISAPTLAAALSRPLVECVRASTSSGRPARQPTLKTTRKKRRYIWRKTAFQSPPSTFIGDDKLDEPILSFETPLQYFTYFFDENLLKHIAEESTKYSIQKDTSKPFVATQNELKKYIGICLLLGLNPQSNIRSLWNSELGVPLIYDCMTLTHFERIRRFIHFNDNLNFKPRGEPGHDRLFRIRPVLETLRKKCQSIPKRETLSVDEQMCATKACNFLRQYLPNKPHKWGYKLLVLCDDTGFAYDFEIYSGTENDPNLRPTDEPDLGASSNIVVRLCRTVPKAQNYKVFFDNYYTSPELISYLAKIGIQSLGTVNRGRLGTNIQMSSQKELSKAKTSRGYSEEWQTIVEDVPVVAVMWLDNKPVTLASSFVGEQPKEKVKRFCKKSKQYTDVDCPNIIRHYNRHMGGVDLLDSFIGKHKIKMRTRKWYMRLFYHLLDVMLINSWLLYKRVQKQRENNSKLLKLREFRLQVAKALCLSGPSLMRKRGRPSSFVSDMLEERMKKKPNAIVPPKDARTDGIDHLPLWLATRQRCKFPGCKGKSFVNCEKCKVALCLNKDKNCFMSFHK